MTIAVDRLIFILTLALFSLVTVLDGSRNEIVSAVFFTAFESLLLLWLLFCSRLTWLTTVMTEFKWVWLLLAAWLVYGYMQTYGVSGLETVDPYASYRKMIAHTGYCATLLLVLLLVRNMQRARLLIFVIVGVALAQTLFGLVNYYGKEAVFGWVPTHYASHRVTGSYVNRNFYANLVLMSLGFVLLPLLYSRSKSRRGRSMRQPAGSSAAQSRFAVSVLLIGVSAVLLAGLFLSGSRAAFLTLIAVTGLTTFLIIYQAGSRLALGGMIAAAGIAVGLFGTSVISHRLQALTQGIQSRWEQWVWTLDLAGNNWLTGYGPGTYEAVFKTRTGGDLGPMSYNHAHNDYLEILIEQGMLGSILIGCFILVVLIKLLQRYLHSQRTSRKTMLLACLFGICAMNLHAQLDFPFQVPANTLVYLAIVAIGLCSTKAVIKAPARAPSIPRSR